MFFFLILFNINNRVNSQIFLDFSQEVFTLTTDTQDAVFFIDVGWVGGGGTMPILGNEKYGRPKKLNGLDIYFDQDYSEQVKVKLPDCRIGMAEIMVKAKIYLKTETVSVTSNPPQSRTIYEAKVVELKDILVKTEPCKD